MDDPDFAWLMIDASHGGAELGSQFSEIFVEKDFTLAIAKRLKSELQKRGVPV